jgi:ABC-type nitrate/sulfonate/bicarbonate transport system permease component
VNARRLAKHALSALPAIAFIAALLGVLEALVRLDLVDKTFVPLPSAVALRTWEIVVSGGIIAPLASTLSLLFAGYVIGCVAAIVLGLLMGNYRRLYNLFEPLTELLRPIPKAALLPALILFLGVGPAMKITLVALAAFFPVLINTVQGVRAVEPVLTDMARTYDHSDGAILFRILLPASAPYILGGMRVSLGISLIVVIIGEMVSASGGLGDVIIHGQRMFLVVDSYAWVVIVGALGFILNALFRWAERRTTFWVAPASE